MHGATTLDEYRKFIEKDGALERRFQTIMVNPPSKVETVEILKDRDKYEAHHRVQITDKAIEEAVELSTRYISGRFLRQGDRCHRRGGVARTHADHDPAART